CTEEFLENIPNDSNTAETNANLTLETSKGKTAGNTRFKRPLETSNDSNEISNERNQNKCSYCNYKKHNHATYPSNLRQNKKKKMANKNSN
ncbi:4668_t:CDS:2, partial [Rhizophagus irregularis]